ncbi:MAG: response regulator transcription factor [Bacteroidota bacterium]
MPIQVLLYEDNENLRHSISTMLQWNQEYNLVAAMPDALDVNEDIKMLKPDVVLMDIDMPNSNGVDAVTQIRTVYEDLPIIMFTVFEDDENIFNAIRAGANGYLLKRNFDQIPAAIKDVLDGGAPMTSSVAKKVLSFVPKNKPFKNTETETLSPRETEILEYVVKGFSYKMIATEIKLSVETVRTHIKHIYKKLQVNSATGAVNKFMQNR